MAAALHTTHHADDKREMPPIRRVMAPKLVVSSPRCHTGSLGSGYVVVGD
ncbi:hypothetical protein [Chloroflexus sp.]|nr:hypothetical protein [Chloroflexus sp.]